jgi:tetratricopeptide (TPR) repeat protein
LRITADLVSAETGRQLWSESYDLALTDLIEVQEAIAQQIAAVIEPELAYVERAAAMRKPPANIGAWDCYQRGFFHLWGFTTPGIAEAEVMFRRAIELDPGFARAYGALGYVKVQSAAIGDPASRPAAVRAALEYARTAVALDDRDCMNQCVLGRALVLSGNLHEAIPALEQSITLNPSFAQAYFALAQVLVLVGREREGIAQLERATRLSPRDPHLWTFHAVRAAALISLGELEQAAEFARRAVRHPAATYWAHVTLVVALGLLGHTGEAQAACAELLARIPDYSVARARADFVGLFSASERFMERFAEGLRRAGIPEQPAHVVIQRTIRPNAMERMPA